MRTFTVQIIETNELHVPVAANSPADAMQRVEKAYEADPQGLREQWIGDSNPSPTIFTVLV